MKKKLDRREAVRERKALSAAHIEKSIEKELIERLKSKAYGDAPLNVNESVWQAILDREKNGDKGKGLTDADELDMIDDETDEEDEDELEEEMDDEWGTREFVSDISGDEDDGLSDLEDVAVRLIIMAVNLLFNAFHRHFRMTTLRTRMMGKMTMTMKRLRANPEKIKSRQPKLHSENGRHPPHPNQDLRRKGQTRNRRVSLVFSHSSWCTHLCV